ncbi:hypothetical protein R2R35_02150 [Anaerocolumna sp. AGMB13020]|uniref:hypothetical protein n=1 Tax=Anaerocolumna sp. AGMB13020 TaxID=3081750 RepID=UPI002954B4FA|nr:hypothetical protein [Anaerocolumna sp. AGMB13020]WOO37317.1 hypothetical protein R2R35_02150 [Anaerocolumna sp. AGMB13020]
MFKKRVLFIIITFSFLYCLNDKVVSAESKSKPTDIQIQASGNNLDDFIPKDWKLISKVKGDLNKDKLKDIAAVIEYTGNETDDEEDRGKPRVLFIILQKKDGSYKLAVQSANLIMREGEGGVFGDPFDGMVYNKGTIVVSFYGGSAWRWGYTYRFRYQNKDWYLIGKTELSENVNTGESKIIDTNCNTGNQIITSVDTKGKKKVVTHNIGKKQLKKLTDF